MCLQQKQKQIKSQYKWCSCYRVHWLWTKQLLPSRITQHEQEKQNACSRHAKDERFKEAMYVIKWRRDVHTKKPRYKSFHCYRKGCYGQRQLELNEFISLVVKLDVYIILCVIDIFTHLEMSKKKGKYHVNPKKMQALDIHHGLDKDICCVVGL